MRKNTPRSSRRVRVGSEETEALRREWVRSAESVPGSVSIHLQNRSGPVARHDDEVPHYAASTIKIAVLITALAEAVAGRLDLGRPVHVTDTFPSVAGGQFTMIQTDDQDDETWRRRGGFIPLHILLERMIVESSNIATNVVVERITLDAINRTLTSARATGLVFRHFIGDRQASSKGFGNQVTALGLTRLMRQLARGALLPQAQTEAALDLMYTQRHRHLIPAGLPASAWSANKPGWTDSVNHDVALVRPDDAPEYVLAVCTTTNDEVAATHAIAEISATTWAHWSAWHQD